MSEEPIQLIDMRMKDGSRHFAGIPDTFGFPWTVIKQRLSEVPGIAITEFIDTPIQSIADFTFRGYEFTMDTQFGELWFFAKDPACPNEVLVEVVRIFRQISD
jgi:hypothetical protein